MNANYEILNHIYKDSSMAVYSTKELLDEIRDKENKIKMTLSEIIDGYEKYVKKSDKLIDKHDEDAKGSGMMAKIGAKSGIKKEVKKDNSDSAIADMMIKGVTIGTIDMEKKINTYSEDADRKTLKFAKEFLKFQKESIEKLKEFL